MLADFAMTHLYNFYLQQLYIYIYIKRCFPFKGRHHVGVSSHHFIALMKLRLSWTSIAMPDAAVWPWTRILRWSRLNLQVKKNMSEKQGVEMIWIWNMLYIRLYHMFHEWIYFWWSLLLFHDWMMFCFTVWNSPTTKTVSSLLGPPLGPGQSSHQLSWHVWPGHTRPPKRFSPWKLILPYAVGPFQSYLLKRKAISLPTIHFQGKKSC